MLSLEQVRAFHEHGYLILPEFFSADEVEIINREIDSVTECDFPGRILEKDRTVRSVLGPHLISDFFDKLAHLEKIVVPIRQLLEEEVYIHQVKINHKRALAGDRWDWHQDLYYWQKMDGFPGSGAVTIGIFLDDVSHENGPLMLIPGSHRNGVVELPMHESHKEVTWESNFSSDLTFKVGPEKLREIAKQSGVVSAVGKRGFAVFFHDAIFHGSNTNMSHNDRISLYYTYNKMSNAPKKLATPRPVFAATQDILPLKAMVPTIV